MTGSLAPFSLLFLFSLFFSYLVVRLPSRVLLLREFVADAVDDEADVRLVDKVRRARDVVEVGRPARPVLHLLRVADKPRRDVVVLGEALDFREHLRDVLGLGDVAGPLVVELVVGVDDQAANAVAIEGGDAENACESCAASVESGKGVRSRCDDESGGPLTLSAQTPHVPHDRRARRVQHPVNAG